MTTAVHPFDPTRDRAALERLWTATYLMASRELRG
jgi:hypothetical protein